MQTTRPMDGDKKIKVCSVTLREWGLSVKHNLTHGKTCKMKLETCRPACTNLAVVFLLVRTSTVETNCSSSNSSCNGSATVVRAVVRTLSTLVHKVLEAPTVVTLQYDAAFLCAKMIFICHYMLRHFTWKPESATTTTTTTTATATTL